MSRRADLHRPRTATGRERSAIILSVLLTLVVPGCATAPEQPPVIGSPGASAPATASPSQGRADQLREQWALTGIDLPSDWPDVPVPRGTQVASAYAVDAPPRRTWTASFVGSGGTALELAEEVSQQLRAAGYQPVSAYSASGDKDAGLFGFAGPQYSVYLLLGELDGHPNLLMTVRQRGAESSGATGWPSAAPSSPGPNAPTGASPATAQGSEPAPTAS